MNKKILLPAIIVVLNLIAFMGNAQNVGIGQSAPASKMDIKGNLTVGNGYSGTAAPANGAIIQGNVGIGNSSPSALLTIGTSAPVTVDNSGNIAISSLSSGSVVMTGAGGLLQIVTAPELTNTFLEWDGTAYTWASPGSASLSNLTPGTGLSGFVYNGGTPQTWSVSYGSTSGTAVQGNTQITVSAGTGISGGGTITLGSGGTVTLNNSGILSIGVTSPIASTGGVNPTISLGTVGVANGGTGLTSVGANGTVLTIVSGVPTWATAATGTVTSVTASSPLASSGGATPNISLGTVPVANGGTGATTLTSNGVLYGNGTSAVGASAGTSGQVLVANSSSVPTFVTMSGDATISSTGVVTVSGSGSGNGYIKNQDASQQSADYYISGPASIGAAPSSYSALTVEAGSTYSTGIVATGGSTFFGLFGGTGVAGTTNSSLFGGIGVSGYSPGVLSGIGVAGYYGSVPGFFIGSAGVLGTSNTSGIPAIYAYNSSSNGEGLLVSGTSSLQGSTTITGNVSSSGNATISGTSNLVGATTLGTTAGTNITGVLVYDNSANNNAVTIQSGATSSNYTLTLPTAAPTANGQALTSTTGGTLSWTTETVGTVTSVTASSPLASSGGATPNISLGTVTVANGGTGLTSYAIGDIPYASAAGTLNKLSDVATGNVLISGGVGAAPSYGKVALASAVSGTLPVANGGTGLATTAANGQLLIGNGSGYALNTLTAGAGISISNAAGTITINSTDLGTVTSITASSPLTGGTITNSGTIGITQATTSTNGYLSSTDWNTFNNKGTVTSIATTGPITGGTITRSGSIGITQATTSTNGYLSSTDWNTFNNKVSSVSANLPLSVGGTPTAPSISLGTVGIGNGGTGLTAAATNGQLLIGNGSGYALANLTAGTGINITNAAGAITISSTATVSGTAGGVLYGTGSSYGSSAAGTSGQVLVSGGSGAPTWASAFSGTGFTVGTGLSLSGSTLNSYWTFDNSGSSNLYNNNTGNIGIGTATPSALFSVGAGATSPFQINSSGAIAAATGITSSGTITFSVLGSGLIKSSAAGVLSNAVAGTDYQAPMSAGTGISIASNTISNTGVISVGAFSPLVSSGGATPNITLGTVPVANGGTGLTAAASNGQLLIGNGSGYTLSTLTAGSGITITNASGAITIANSGSSGVTSITGTANQVIASASTGAVTLSLPQSIGTGSSPTFAGLNLSGLTASSGVYTDASKNLTSTIPASGTLGFWTLSSGNLYPSNLADAVGIGTNAPAGDAGIAVKNGHYESQQTTAPTTTVGTAAGSGHGASASLTNATDVGGAISVTTGSNGHESTGAYVTINFNQNYTTAPIVVITPTDATSAAAMNSYKVYVTSSTSSFTINFGSTGASSTTFNFNYMMLETQ